MNQTTTTGATSNVWVCPKCGCLTGGVNTACACGWYVRAGDPETSDFVQGYVRSTANKVVQSEAIGYRRALRDVLEDIEEERQGADHWGSLYDTLTAKIKARLEGT